MLDMYVYFFDIDNTLADTDAFLQSKLPNNYQLLSRKKQIEILNHIMTKDLYLDIPILQNSATNLLLFLLEKKADIYFITARESKIKEETEKWLDKHNLLFDKNRLIMDAEKKGEIINHILKEKHSSVKFAMLFDDSTKIHNEIALYNNIIACLP